MTRTNTKNTEAWNAVSPDETRNHPSELVIIVHGWLKWETDQRNYPIKMTSLSAFYSPEEQNDDQLGQTVA